MWFQNHVYMSIFPQINIIDNNEVGTHRVTERVIIRNRHVHCSDDDFMPTYARAW